MIKVENIIKSYNQKRIINDVSFELKPGRITGLLGPNGAGKTTLIRLINNITQAEKGIISFDEELLNEKHVSKIGYLPEERGLYKNMTVKQHALFIGQLRGLSKKDSLSRLSFWLEKWGVSDWQNKRIEELSKRMAQKIQFIITVLHDPEVLILDEPFSGFDPVNIDLVRKEILQLKKEGKTILLSTHNMKNVEEICDDVIMINHGEKVLEGSVFDLRYSNKEEKIRLTFEGNMIAFANSLWVGYELIEQTNIRENEFSVILKLRNGNKINDLLNTVIPEVKILHVEEVIPSMENIFLAQINQSIPAHE